MRGRQFPPHDGRRGRGGSGQVKEVKAEIPRRAAPDYITERIGDRFVPAEIAEIAERTPPGHRFLLYFHGMSDEVRAEYIEREEQERRDMLNRAKQACDWPVFEKVIHQEKRGRIAREWGPIKDGRRHALKACEAMGRCATGLLQAWHARMRDVAPAQAWQAEVQTIAPLITGGGNPHPVENGFAFLNPYGVPYLAASGVKGALRRVAEEMALEGESGWTIAHVWVLFGFDENSQWYRAWDKLKTPPSDADQDQIEAWKAQVSEYETLIGRVEKQEEACSLLDKWKGCVQAPLLPEAEQLDGVQFARELLQKKNWRRRIKWRGLLCFADAVPHPGANLMVDVLNPHHGTYYRAEPESATPHDAENPVPVFFLALAPGARLTLRAWPLASETHEVLRACGDWRALLDALVDRMTDEAEGCGLGFGAKTSVGYGAMREDPRERERRLAEEERRRQEEKERRLREEQERKRREEEEQRRREFEALPEHERVLVQAQQAVDAIRQGLAVKDSSAFQELRRIMKDVLEKAKGWDEPAKARAAEWLEQMLDAYGSHPDMNQKKRKQWRKRMKDSLRSLKGDT